MIRTRLLRSIGCLLGIMPLLFSGCGKAEVEERAPVARPVKVLIIGKSPGGVRSMPGRVAAANQVDLSFRVGGPLIEFPVVEGQEVAKGRLMARIDPRDFQVKVNSARAEFERAQADFERFSALYEKDAVSKAQLDQSQAALDVTRATLDNAEDDLRYTYLRAPFSGQVGETFVENFQDVRQKEAILSLVDVDHVEILIDLPETSVARIRKDRNVGRIFATFDAAPGREFDLEIKEMATQADPRTMTYRVTLLMPQPEGLNVLPGMTATVVRHAPDGDGDAGVTVIPAIAVFADEAGNSLVWVVDRETSRVHRRGVTTGDLTGMDHIEIADGLRSGESIAISGVSQLRDDMEIRPIDELGGL